MDFLICSQKNLFLKFQIPTKMFSKYDCNLCPNSGFQRGVSVREYRSFCFLFGVLKDNRINFTVNTMHEERCSTSMLQSFSLTFLCEVGRKLNCLILEEEITHHEK